MMDLQLFQVICIVVLAVAYAIMWSTTPREDRPRLLVRIVVIAIGAWLAEDTAIMRYRFYAYPDWWWVKLHEVPLLVIAIWPVVVLSSEAVLVRIWPSLAGLRLAAAVGAAVVVDATLIETIAADAQLWHWSEGGYLGVPLIGMLGWGAYAASIVWAMDFKPRGFSLPMWTAPILAVGGTHLLLVALWWGGFRFVARGDLPVELVWVAVAACAVFALVLLKHRRQDRLVPPTVALTRMLAASVFVVLLAHSETSYRWALWAHLGAIALPYLATVDWRAFGSQSSLPPG